MIDPHNITDYNLSDSVLEEHILFWILAAGKRGETAAICLDKFLEEIEGKHLGPMRAVFEATFKFNLPFLMRDCGIGCYMSKARSFLELAVAIGSEKLDLRTCSTEDLEKIHGIGPKTARCFILHSRKGARLSGLDTHMLKHLREMGIEGVPKSTPSSKKKYMILEQEVLRLADEAGIDVAVYDLMVWNKYSVKSIRVLDK
jgi:thermostable 8-oxoguanine DNA glycosylase